jgi:hypothetical protein
MPKTGAERVAEFKKRQADAGLKLVHNVWAHPDDHETIKALSRALAWKRGQGSDEDQSISEHPETQKS